MEKPPTRSQTPSSTPTAHEPLVVPSLSSPTSLLLMATTCFTMIIYIASIGSMFIMLPTIGRDLLIDPASLQWLVTAYALTSGCFLLLFGRLADIFGRKVVFVAGSLWFIAFTIGCGFSNGAFTLIIMRALTGIGGAAMIPACIGILAHAFPPSYARTVAFSMFQAAAPCGGVLGMVVGGIVTEYAAISWRALFFVLAGIGGLVLIGAILVFPKDHDFSEDKRVDWLGAFLITAGLVLLLFCLGEGEIAPEQWNTPYIIALLILSGLLIVGFIAWEHYVETHLTLPPLMKLDLFARGNWKFSAVLLISFLVNGAFSSWQYWATLYYQNYQFLSPIMTVVRFLPMTVVGFSVNVIFAIVAAHVSGYVLITFGCLGTGIASILFALISPDEIYWAFGFPAAFFDVLGADIIMAAGSLYVSMVALPHEQSLAGGVFNTITQIGISFATTVSTIVYDRSMKSEAQREGIVLDQYATNASPAALLYGYRRAQWANLAFALFATAVSAVLLRGIGMIGVKPERKGAGDLEASKEPIVEGQGLEKPAGTIEDVGMVPGLPARSTAAVQ
ncbi:MFS general substrate transporter [Calocera cornea HHB12733]|uniref:MFS general substrate transporter n=1 Tax=Calocera cornea HHB12733 TaxID=1353952 RepID=A0A165FXW0_9BASI|nr:MFS general substrate transporter [Calocera cornea HHB12733]